MSYRQRIAELIGQVPASLVDLSIARKPARVPTQASSEFTTNREQGDWAENILLAAINASANHHVAVRYGKSDDRVAGEEGFAEFYQEFQDELDTIGKRPDLLIFRRGDVPAEWGPDISRRPRAELDAVVGRALAGLEVRSSAFLSAKYDEAMAQRTQRCTEAALRIKAEIQRPCRTARPPGRPSIRRRAGQHHGRDFGSYRFQKTYLAVLPSTGRGCPPLRRVEGSVDGTQETQLFEHYAKGGRPESSVSVDAVLQRAALLRAGVFRPGLRHFLRAHSTPADEPGQ